MKYLILIIILTCSFLSCDNISHKKNENTFFIIGELETIADHTKVFLKVQKSNKTITLDTAYTSQNAFQFSGAISKPEIFGIYIDGIKGSIGLFIQNDSVFIDVDENTLNNSIIKGSELNDQYLSFVKKSNEIISRTNYLFPLFQKARTENDVEKLIEINKKIEGIHQENRAFVISFIRENQDSYIASFALYLLLKNESISKDTIASIYSDFSHDVKKGDLSMAILLYLDSINKIK